MEARDMPMFTARIKALCQVFGAGYSPEVDDAYFHAVHDIDAAAVKQGLDLLESTSKFMPKPVEVREASLNACGRSIAHRCPEGARLFAPRYAVSVEGFGVVATVGEFGGYAVRRGSSWVVYELTGSTGTGARELWSGEAADRG